MDIDTSGPEFSGNNYCIIDGYWWYRHPEKGWIKKQKVEHYDTVSGHRTGKRPVRK